MVWGPQGAERGMLSLHHYGPRGPCSGTTPRRCPGEADPPNSLGSPRCHRADPSAAVCPVWPVSISLRSGTLDPEASPGQDVVCRRMNGMAWRLCSQQSQGTAVGSGDAGPGEAGTWTARPVPQRCPFVTLSARAVGDQSEVQAGTQSSSPHAGQTGLANTEVVSECGPRAAVTPVLAQWADTHVRSDPHPVLWKFMGASAVTWEKHHRGSNK